MAALRHEPEHEAVCARCGEIEAYGPDDHACAENLELKLKKLLEGINPAEDEGWDSLTTSSLFAHEAEINRIYGLLQEIEFIHERAQQEAGRHRAATHAKAENARKTLNQVRAHIRLKMKDVE